VNWRATREAGFKCYCDIVQFLLADRPDLRKELIRKKWKVAIMAQTEVTYDIPEHRKYRRLPKIDDERLTPEQRDNKPGGVGTMTGEQYWNARRSTGEATFAKGTGATPPTALASWGALGFIPLEGLQTPRVADESEALAAAKQLLDAGTDGLKVYAVTIGRNGLALPESAIQAVVKEAHGRGKPVFAHPTTEAGLMASVRAGVDVLAHTTPQSGPWSQGVPAAMKQAGIALVPTLSLWRYELRHERISLGDGFQETAVGQLRAWLGVDGVVLFGTDVGYMTDYDPAEEYVLMTESGMSFRQILASLTTAPAERFGASKQLGRIATGFAADLTVLKGDPSKDVRALTAVHPPSATASSSIVRRAD
jgi:Amidohydrolase family